jgi:valyl-tRNA synthetase
MLGDTAIAINPHDDRYTSLADARVVLPLVGRELPFIRDEVVEKISDRPVKVTPAHDPE